MQHTYSARALQYAEDVVSEKILACKFVQLACKRFIDDLKRAAKKWEFHYDPEAAEHACKFTELLPHVKGKWAKKKERIKLEPWQIFIKCNLFGWKDKEGNRRFRESYKEIPRKNGKSVFASTDGLYLFAADDEYGAEVYSGATTEHQAWEVYRPAMNMAKRTPELRDRYGIEVAAKNMSIPANGSRFEPIIGDPGDGASPSMWIVDEYHEHKKNDLYETGESGMGAREQPLMYVITTAGGDFGSPCYDKRKDAIKILQGLEEDHRFFAIIYTIDEGDKWDSIDALKKSNPNFGISVSKVYLERELKKARRSATAQTSFKTKHLNMWVGAKNAWMNMLAWQAQKRKLDINKFKHLTCHAALDLASKTDIATLVVLFKDGDKYYVFLKAYVPEAKLEGSADQKNDRYDKFVNGGWLTTTPGNMIDYDFIKEDLTDLLKEFDVESVAYDPFQATYLVTELQKQNVNLVEYNHTVKNMSEPMKEVEALVIDKKLFHDGNPCMTWMVGNCVARKDAKDNIYPRKENDNDPRCKIDGVVSLIMAMGRWLADDAPDNPYESRGLRFL